MYSPQADKRRAGRGFGVFSIFVSSQTMECVLVIKYPGFNVWFFEFYWFIMLRLKIKHWVMSAFILPIMNLKAVKQSENL
ncbi:hypothetical protein NB703_000879 [Pantoea ananatis]|uniref:Uncharacterized protein n=1 Tax=Pantoea ananas TaxID=553 RepID=A0AAJ1CXS2_PANAN|nr:hypothetical protein [Pantoea ananatis]MCW0338109.1 hypothetical protein [Pantoea ananatis]MCW0342786.1 hypothetical protein [Pantoea ananatis]MCW0356096.1 hypothetical protein [Pantoea ananatis]MCW0360762.1 hypothetical protein [Pantoea ananatis]